MCDHLSGFEFGKTLATLLIRGVAAFVTRASYFFGDSKASVHFS
jgi:hypothetical protein